MNLLATLVPYIAVWVGMYLLHSAWAAVLLYHAGIIAFLFYRHPVGIWKKACAGMNLSMAIPGVVVCALAAPIIYFMWPWFAASESILPQWLARYGLTGWSWILMMPYFAIVHPVLEEIHWRGISPKQASGICRQDLLFAGYHVLVLLQLMYWPWLFLVFGVLVCSSVFWRRAVDRLGGYALAILTHAAADAGVVLGVHLLLCG